MKNLIAAGFTYLLIGLSFVLPFRLRVKFIGWAFGKALPALGGMRRRANDNFDHVMPHLNTSERRDLLSAVGRNAGQTAAEIIFNKQFARHAKTSKFQGPGLAALQDAKNAGKGALIISAHFGQWEAIRHVLKSQGMETGAVFKPLSNPWLKTIWRKGIELGGKPLVTADAQGTMEMIRHVRAGGFMAILIDQKFPGGELVDFLGKPAQTSTAVAKLALKFDVPLVPAFAKRNEETDQIEIEFCDPIKGTDALDMTAQANAIISQKIIETPNQWFWLHRRWRMHK